MAAQALSTRAAAAAALSSHASLAAATEGSVSFFGLRKDVAINSSSSTRKALQSAGAKSRKAVVAVKASANQTVAAALSTYVPPKKILMMGGSRFIGVYLARALVKAGHEVTLFTRGKSPVTQQLPGESNLEYAEYSSRVRHLKGDRKDFDNLRSLLKGSGFQVVYDINGRDAAEAEPILDALPNLEQYIFCSSAGVYLKSDVLPHREEDAVDPKSRHKGKLDTEALLQARGAPWTSIRPVYIYGPLNYNPVEEWFFQRIAAGRPVPVPNSGMQVTQLGHVKDLVKAFELVLANPLAIGEVFNISGPRYVTFDGIAKACAEAMGAPAPEIVHFNPKEFDFGKKKAFPLRDQHFFASNDKAEDLLGWKPQYGLVDGLRDSYLLDFSRGTFRKAADFETDDIILAKKKAPAAVAAAVSSPSSAAAHSIYDLRSMPLPRLKALARQQGITATSKPELIRLLASVGGAPGAGAPASSSAGGSSATEAQLQAKSIGELRAMARERGLRGDTKAEIIKILLSAPSAAKPAVAAVPGTSFTSPSAAPAASSPSLSEKQLLTKTMGELRALAAQRGIRGGTKAELVKELLKV